MNIFVIHSGADYDKVQKHISELRKKVYNLNALALENGGKLWKTEAAVKIKKSQMVVFFIGEKSHESANIEWEIKTAIKHGKPIYTIKFDDSYKTHPALTTCDKYSKQTKRLDTETSFDNLCSVIKNYNSGDYHVFNTTDKDIDKSILLEQYKLFLQTSEDLVARRQSVNSFYISLNSAIIAIFSAILAFDMTNLHRILIGLLFAIVGIILSISWIKILIAYGNLNSSKMKIISSIEKQLPASLYDAEWAALSDKLNKKKYVSFTDNEKRIPKIFILIYAIIIAILVIAFILSLTA